MSTEYRLDKLRTGDGRSGWAAIRKADNARLWERRNRRWRVALYPNAGAAETSVTATGDSDARRWSCTRPE